MGFDSKLRWQCVRATSGFNSDAVPEVEVAHAGLCGTSICGPSMSYAVRLTMVQSVSIAQAANWLAKTP